MRQMRAKVYVSSVEKTLSGELLTFRCVTEKPYDGEGNSEDNTFAKYSPNGTVSIQVTNPALHDQFKPGQKFYIDFTEAAS